MWATARLSEVASIRHGGTPSKKEPRFWNGDIPWVSPKDMGGSILTDTEDHITADGVACSATSVMPANSIFVVARSGILAHSVPVALARRPMAFNQDIKAITVNQARLDADYAFWCLRSQQGRILVQGVKRGATVHSLHSGFVENLSIPLPPLEEQRRIVDILNHASGIRRLRREALDKTRQLIPALFVEMFGDPATNPKGWPVRPLGSVLTNHDSRRVPVKASDRAKRQGRYPYYGASGIIDHIDDYLFDGRYLLIAEDGANLLARSTPIAFCVSGKFWVNNHAHILGEGTDAGLDFVECYLNRINLREYITGSAQPKLNQASLNRIPTPLPPRALQEKFALRTADIRSTIGQQERMAEASEQLVAALMARLFDGAASKPDALAVPA